MTISITWTDAANGTGGAVTVTGADASTVTVTAQAVDATGLRTPSWVVVGSRTGDGSVTVALSPGYYWLHATGEVSGQPALSNLVYAYVTDDADSLASRCVDALAARLAGLVMASDVGVSVPNTRIYKRVLPAPDGLFQYPCVILTHEGNREGQEGTTNNKDDISYPINVWVCDRHGTDYEAKRKTWLNWRQQVFRALRNQRLAGVTESLTVKVEPMLVFDPKLPAYQEVILGFVARCLCREMRGT